MASLMQYRYGDTEIEFNQIAYTGAAVWEAKTKVSQAQALVEPWHEWVRGYGQSYQEAAIDLLRAIRHVRLAEMPIGELPY